MQANYSHTEKQWNSINASLAPDLFSDAHGLLDARIGYGTDRWNVALLGQNLTGERYFVSTNDIIGGVPIGVPNVDTRYRVEFGFSF